MAIQSGYAITYTDLYNGFISNIYTPITNGAYSLDNIPIDYCEHGTRDMVPRSAMASLAALRIEVTDILANIGASGAPININTLRAYMLAALKPLTRVGTWDYIRYYSYTRTEATGTTIVQDEQQIHCDTGGVCVFNSNYIRSIGNPNVTFTYDTSANKPIITASYFINYYAALLSTWNSCSRNHSSERWYTCHDVCHTNCHSNCHSDGCYK